MRILIIFFDQILNLCGYLLTRLTHSFNLIKKIKINKIIFIAIDLEYNIFVIKTSLTNLTQTRPILISFSTNLRIQHNAEQVKFACAFSKPISKGYKLKKNRETNVKN